MAINIKLPTPETNLVDLAAVLGHKSVKWFGATGNGSTDDTAAIQSAVNTIAAPFSNTKRGTIFFPAGSYLITAPITWEFSHINIRFLGDPGSEIFGNFGDALLKRGVLSPISGVHVIENLWLTNYHNSGKCILAHSCVSVAIRNCQIRGPGGANVPLTMHGIETHNSSANTIDSCSVMGCGIGIVNGNGSMVLNCDVTGNVEGVRHQNLGLQIYGGRWEVNKRAIVLGQDENGNALQSSGVHLALGSMESNGWAFVVGSTGSGVIEATAITINEVTTFNPAADEYGGIKIDSSTSISVIGVGMGAPNIGTGAAFRVGTSVDRITFISSSASLSGGTIWDIGPKHKVKFINTNNPAISTFGGDLGLPSNAPYPLVTLNSAADRTIGVYPDSEWAGWYGVPYVGVEFEFTNIGSAAWTLNAQGATLVNATNNKLLAGKTGTLKYLGSSTWRLAGAGWSA